MTCRNQVEIWLPVAAALCQNKECSIRGLSVSNLTFFITSFCSAISASIKGIHGLKPSSNCSLILLSLLMITPTRLVEAVSTLDLGMVASLTPIGMLLVAITPMSAHEPSKPMCNCKRIVGLRVGITEFELGYLGMKFDSHFITPALEL